MCVCEPWGGLGEGELDRDNLPFLCTAVLIVSLFPARQRHDVPKVCILFHSQSSQSKKHSILTSYCFDGLWLKKIIKKKKRQ